MEEPKSEVETPGPGVKKKKKKVSKTERQRKREEKKFKELYGPKDSRVQCVSLEALKKLRGESSQKRPKKPMMVSLDELLTVEKSEKPRDKSLVKRQVQSSSQQAGTTGNILDASGPKVISRGKQRETPRTKRPSKLKKAILAGRTVQEQSLSTIEMGSSKQPEEDDSVIEPILWSTHTAEETQPDISIPNSTFNENFAMGLASLEGECSITHRDATMQSTTDTSVAVDFATLIINAEEENVSPSSDVVEKVKASMHSRKFRSYCDMFVSFQLHGHVIELLQILHRFQDRLYHTDPIKYKTKRRYVNGLKDVLSYLEINKVVLVIIAPDIEKNNVEGGLDEKIHNILALAKEKNVPYIFSGNRFILGRPIRNKTPTSAIGILDKQNAETVFAKVIEEANGLRHRYQLEFNEKARHLSAVNLYTS